MCDGVKNEIREERQKGLFDDVLVSVLTNQCKRKMEKSMIGLEETYKAMNKL